MAFGLRDFRFRRQDWGFWDLALQGVTGFGVYPNNGDSNGKTI